MPWERVGDSAATHPVVLRGGSVRGADSRTRLELFGFVALCGSLSAQHMTDYVVELGTAELVGGRHTSRLLRQACEAGYMVEVEIDGRRAWRIVEDAELIHIRLRKEVEWDRQRKRDNSNLDVTLEVLARDGSACRICGRTVNWADRRGTRGGTYDHRAEPAVTPDDSVVACRGCNSSRGQAKMAGNLESWDRENPLRSVPPEPYYCDHALARLQRHGIDVTSAGNSFGGKSPADTAPVSARSDSQSEDAPGERPATRPRDQRDNAKGHGSVKPGGSGSRVRKPASPGRDGSGSGRSGQGRSGSAPDRRRRGKRGGRGR